VKTLPLLAGLLWLAGASPLAAQVLPSEPLVFGDGRIAIGGDVSATFSCADSNLADAGVCADDAGFFNYTDYEHSATRMLRVDLAASVRANDHLSVLGEIRLNCGSAPPCGDGGGSLEPYGFYLRIRPWTSRAFDIQVGRVPPTFGAFTRRTYPADNMLIGYPLGYQYLTSLRPDALPANADDLLRMRGRGWLSSFPVGDATPRGGMPLVNALHWDTGVQAHGAAGRFDAAIAVTSGTLGNPLLTDDNGGKQIAGRVTARPVVGLILGASAARGPFATSEAMRAAGHERDAGGFSQTAWGADAEYSAGYYLVRFETIVSTWHLPGGGARVFGGALRAFSTSTEGRYKFHPGMYVAARLDRLDFSEVSGTARRDEWDAPVTRLEAGAGFSIQRNLVLKLSFQTNRRDTGRIAKVNLAAVQVVFWL
jgi:hypothetical protein